MKQYVNLHNHTTFSLLDGHGPIEKYVKRAKELGQPALAITDHGSLFGWLDHYEKCKEYGIKPILGIEGYLARKGRFDRDEEERAGRATDELDQRGPYHVTILAKNNTGYHNLIELSSGSYLEGYYVKPRMDLELIDKHSEGLIVLSGCINGDVNQALLRGDYDYALQRAATMQSIVGKENYFIEIHNHGIPEQLQVIPDLVKIAKQIGAKTVASGDCHYVNKEDHDSHDALICLSTGSKVADENRFKFIGPEFYLKSYDEMAERLEPEWLDNTMAVHEMVDVHLDFLEPDSIEYHFPSYPKLEQGVSVTETLTQDVKAGLVRRYGNNPPQDVMVRLEHEMGVVQRMGFESYFLVVADLVNWAKDNGIAVGAGRGSAAGSLVSFVLGITNIDPIRFDLLFERFLVEGRKSMPDIDIDIADVDRGRVIDYVIDTYGDDRVAHIVTFSEVKARAAIKDTARVLGYEAKVSDRLSKLLPPAIMGVTKTLQESLSHAEFREVYDSEPETKTIVDTAMGIEGVHRQTGVHAAGIVIGDKAIKNYVPLMQKGEGETITTQWDMQRVEEAGLLKIDFLGLRNLTIVQQTIALLKDAGLGLDLDDPNQPYDDPDTYKLLQRGQTIGVFQLESGPMSEMALKLRPENINDIMALISLYRPGPLGSNMDKMYINRKHGREKVTTYHEAIAELMEPTYGLMIYQDQILKLAQILAGFSPGDADDLRKAIGKKLMDKIPIFREKFIQGCEDTVGINARLANKIYDDIEFFGGYGFNKCAIGSTKLTRASANQYTSQDITIEELYNIWYGPHTPARKAYRARGLKVLAHRDGRIVPDRVVNVYKQGYQHVWSVTLENGKNITATSNHRHLTPKGWKEVKDLSVGDELLTIGPYEHFATPTGGETSIKTGKKEAYAKLPAHCQFCGEAEGRLEVAHLNHNKRDNSKDNIRRLCNSCHKQWDYDHGARKPRWSKGRPTLPVAIKSIEYAGLEMTYDVEMEGDDHSWLANGIVTHNSHAISYGVISYQNAFLKAHYPAEYMAALMTSVSDKKEKLFPYLDECRKMGLEVSPPSVITSDKDFTVKDGRLIFGLSAIDGVGDALTKVVVEDREREGSSSSFYEFLKKSSSGALDKRSVEKLLFSGALDDVINNSVDEITDKEIHELLLLEQQQVGIFITGHPLEGIWDDLSKSVSHTITEIEDVEDGAIVTVAGVITGFSQRTTKSGNKMHTVKISDMAGIAEFIIFQGSITKDDLKKEDFNIGLGIRVVLRVKKDAYMEENRTSLYYVRHDVVLDSDVTKVPPYTIDVSEYQDKKWFFTEINDIIKKSKGETPLVLRLKVGDSYLDLTAKERVSKIGIKEIEVLTNVQ